ncbi:MAG TPA: DUF2934 domain-containing protein [Candidatus Paceibacterota bacterium]|nr:DUF2934 domain-containing protein [Candidatus Paceibacterota bacterium]
MTNEVPPKTKNKEIAHADKVNARIEEVKKRQVELAELIKSPNNKMAIEENNELVKEALSLDKESNIIKTESLEKTNKKAYEIYEKRKREGREGNEKTDWEQAEKELNADNEKKTGKIKENINFDLNKKDEEKNKKILDNKLVQAGLSKDDFKNIPEWNDLSAGQKMLVVEQASQDTLSRVREIGEKNFQEKNKLSIKDPKTLPKKILHRLFKKVWISKEEKSVIEDVRNGKIKPDEEKLKQLAERTADMDLNATIKDGKASVEFIPIDKSLSKEQQEVVENYNKLANEFSKMPDSWKNEKAAASKKSNLFNKNKSEHYDKYKNIELQYNEALKTLLELKAKNYDPNTMIQTSNGVYEESQKVAKEKAMLEMKDSDFNVAMLQFTNTNPDAIEELNKIRNESSWGRLVNNETIWRGLYMGIGYGARKGLTYSFGLLAAPIVAGTIGGIRAREKAKQKINTAFMEGRNEETFLERKEAGKKGAVDDKNKNTGIISKVFSGQKINTKEVAAFVDADSQMQRLNNIKQKLEKVSSKEERFRLNSELYHRLSFVEEKLQKGLINYGTKNAIGKNYELLKILGETSIQIAEPSPDLIKEDNRRHELLQKIMKDNEAKLGSKQAIIKNQEMLRGMAVSAGFATLGFYIREFMHHGAPTIGAHAGAINAHIENGHLIKNIDATQADKPLNEAMMKNYFPNTKLDNELHENILNPDAVVHKGEGIESTFIRQIQNNHELAKSLGFKGDANDANALHEFAGREAHILAIKEGYVGSDGQEIRVADADKVAYEIKMENGHAVINEKTVDGKIVETHHEGDKFEATKANKYERVHTNEIKKVEVENENNENIDSTKTEEVTEPKPISKNISGYDFSNKEKAIADFDDVSEETKGTYAEDLMKVNDDPTEQNDVGKALIALRETVKANTGKLINPNPDESLHDYVHRLMNADSNAPTEKIGRPNFEKMESIPAKNVGVEHAQTAQPKIRQVEDNYIKNDSSINKTPTNIDGKTTLSASEANRFSDLARENKILDAHIKEDNPFKGETFASDSTHYRQVGFGESKDLEIARKIANTDYRAKIAMESGVIKLGASNDMELHDLKEVVMQDKTTGLYHVYHAVEVDKPASSVSGTEHIAVVENKANIHENNYEKFHKAFPNSEQVHGMPRAEYDSKVENYLKSKGITWADDAKRDTDLWLWEKFGKVDPMQSPDENPLWQLAKNSRDPSALDLMEVGKDEGNKYRVGQELVKLFNLVKVQTGEEIYPNISPVETPNEYVYRLIEALERKNS